MKPNEETEFLWRRLSEDCPIWAIFIPVLFALLVVGLIVYFRPERKLLSAIIGLSVVGVISVLYLPLAYILHPFLSWMVILVPVMTVALFYVGMMYLKDAKSVHPIWASFLGLLRTCVYIALAIVFLLPGCQHYEKQEYESKVLILFDVSGSMFTVDGVPVEGQDPKLLPSRQDLIANWLIGEEDEAGRQKVAFMDRVLQKTPVTAGRFGAVLDENDMLNLNLKKEKTLTAAEWRKWLKPDKKNVARTFEDIKDDKVRKEKEEEYHKRIDMIEMLLAGTNIGGACLQMHKLENNSFIQAIIVVSDGQSNLGSEDAMMDFKNRANNPKRPIPVITVGVGQFRLPAAIRIDELQAPEETRPDDKFPVRVPVVGTNLHGEEFEVTLEAKRVKDVTGRPVEDKVYELPMKKGKFKAEAGGDHPQDVVEFIIDVSDLKGIPVLDDKNSELEGEWHFTARVPRNKKEATPEKEHVSETVKVQVQKRALRVLLFTSGATREYQFVRTILYREMLEKRMEVCIYNQQNAKDDFIDEGVEADRLLQDFPTKLEPNPGQKYMSLSDYDVVVCFDPDWTKLTLAQRNNLNKWVANYGGGVIFVAGPIYSYQIARPGGHDLTSLLQMYPVVLKDNRLHALPGVAGLGHNTSRPYALNFEKDKMQQFDFLKLEEDDEHPIYAWNMFFWKNKDFQQELAKDLVPYRGFYTYYPVERIKPATLVIATFATANKEARIGDKTDDFKDGMPFLATMPYGTGKTMYIGSGELWRLRSFKEGYHERLWIKMARYASAGAREQKKYGRFLMSRNVPVGQINCEAQVKGQNLQWLPADLRPTVLVKRIDKDRDEKAPQQQFDMKSKPFDVDWQGYFLGKIEIKEPGEYEFQLPIPGTNESLRQTVMVRKSNPELDNVRTNFGYLYQLASESGPLLKNLPPETRKRVDLATRVPDGGVVGEKASKRLFFGIEDADKVADCLVAVQPKTETVKGRFEDLWDAGWETTLIPLPIWACALILLGALQVIGVIILLFLRQWIAAILFFVICNAMAILVGILMFVLENFMSEKLPTNFSYLLMIVVGLLGIEWLARKLLRLA